MVGALLEIAILLVPFMPETADRIEKLFGTGLLKEVPAPLFPKHDAKPAAK
jgi:hypothetical protein